MPGGGGECLAQKSFPTRVAARTEILFWPSRGSGGMLPHKIFKIKDPRLAKNAFPENSASKN